MEDNGVCRFDTAFTITQPSKLITTEVNRSNFNGYNISCFNLSNGSFKALASGGIPGYKYAMTNNPLVLTSYVYSNDGSFDLLKAGDYIVISVDKNNCKSEPLKISLSQPSGITLTTNATDVICRDQKTGSISLVGGQGAGSFKYSIDGGKTFLASNTFNNLSAGTYTAVVKDVNECQLQKQIIISQPDSKLNLSIVKIDSVSCYGNFDGKIQVKGEGGVAPYLYSINSGLERSDYIFYGLNAGKQTLSLKDKLGCKVSLEAIVKQPDFIRIFPIVKNVSCLGLNNGSIEVLVSGGKKPYKYEWEDRRESTNKLTMLSPDIYNITVRDASCSAVKAIKVTQPKDPLILNFKNKKNSICNGRCTGEILLEASGGTLPYSFTWNGDTIKKHPLVKDICKGDYSAEVIDARGCQSIKKINIEDSIEFKWQNLNQIIICPGQILSLDATNTSSSYSWYSENGFSSTGPKANIVSPGKYHLLITNNYGCYLKDTFDIKVSKDVLKAKFLLPSMVPLGDTVAFAEVSKPEPDSVHWRFTNNPIIVDSSSLIPKLIYSAPGVYTVKMTAYL